MVKFLFLFLVFLVTFHDIYLKEKTMHTKIYTRCTTKIPFIRHWTTVIRFVVNVPVLSEHIVVAFPIVSQASRCLTRLLSLIIFYFKKIYKTSENLCILHSAHFVLNVSYVLVFYFLCNFTVLHMYAAISYALTFIYRVANSV